VRQDVCVDGSGCSPSRCAGARRNRDSIHARGPSPLYQKPQRGSHDHRLEPAEPRGFPVPSLDGGGNRIGCTHGGCRLFDRAGIGSRTAETSPVAAASLAGAWTARAHGCESAQSRRRSAGTGTLAAQAPTRIVVRYKNWSSMASIDSPIAELPKAAARSRALSLITVGRLCLIPVVIATFMEQPLVTTLALLAFMCADLGDGVIARRLSADDRLRRATDSTVDRIGIDACLLAACVKGTLPWILFACFVARDLWCAALCARVAAIRGVVVKGDLAYRAVTGSFGLWGLTAPFLSPTARTTFAAAILFVAIVLVVDYSRAIRAVLKDRYVCWNQTVSVAAVREAIASGRAGSLLGSRGRGDVGPQVVYLRCTN
jgi:phosphatidylglycerophosphate synthase